MDTNISSTSTAKLKRVKAPGLELIAVEAPPLVELHVTATPVGNEPPGFTVRRLAEMVNAWDATVVRTLAFGSVSVAAKVHAALRQSLDDPSTPITWVEGGSCDDRPLAGIQVHAIRGARVTTLATKKKMCGRLWKDARATHCVLSGLDARDISVSRTTQTAAAFSQAESDLEQIGMSFKNVARTWFYLDHILDWYGDFNGVRNDFFASAKLAAGNVPASTGVSGRNPQGSALAMAAWAIKPHDSSLRSFGFVPSPKQCPAPAYGSAFSRAVEIESPGFRQLLISGTASIEPDGMTAHVGDIDGQIAHTMNVVEAILESRGMTLDDTIRATAYFRSASDAPRFTAWLQRRELHIPRVMAGCDICRADLLFELELDAIAIQ